MMVGVAEAAKVLGVSERRVRQMLANGAIPANQVGRTWVIQTDDLHSAVHRRRTPGRPWHPRSAWAVLSYADGNTSSLSPADRSRAMRRLKHGLQAVVPRLASRAEVHTFYAHPSVLQRLSESDDIVVGGTSGLVEHNVDLIVSDRVEGYIRAQALSDVARRFALQSDTQRHNVVLRAVLDDLWPFHTGQRVASKSIVATDLLESDDARVVRAGVQLLERP